jgi:uncharacterized protein YjiS (DUF1127 family)
MSIAKTRSQRSLWVRAFRFARVSAKAYGEWRRARDDFHDLASANDRLLKDIGLTRQQAMFARSSMSFAGILKDMLREEDEAEKKRESEKNRKLNSACDSMKKCCSQTC